ncbi:hypothetical protein [Consotaella aegiceratis]|uniref:hypothetical protein n=1 Tax=Consotaella aegiceratis TaxID=3097961 RepID=UPI002F428A64
MRKFLNAALIVLTTGVLGGCLTSGSELGPLDAGAASLGGGLIGQMPGGGLPEDVRRSALDAEFQALEFAPAGQAVPWQAGSYHGEAIPTQLYRVGSQDCRGYRQKVTRGSQTVEQIGTACRTEAGAWKLVV